MVKWVNQLVSLLIGVNNQYQRQDFGIYEAQFPELLSRAISFAGGDSSRVIVLSIPDYAFTPVRPMGGAAEGICQKGYRIVNAF